MGTVATVAADSLLHVARVRAWGMDSQSTAVPVMVLVLVIANLLSADKRRDHVTYAGPLSTRSCHLSIGAL
jgi:hypothetical protein